MTAVKRLLEQATPLPWYWLIDTYEPAKVFITNDPNDEQDPIVEQIAEGDAALIEYAVNRLPDYEAAVDALERLVRFTAPEYAGGSAVSEARASGEEVLSRLRGEAVPA